MVETTGLETRIWSERGTKPAPGDEIYRPGYQPIAGYDNWHNWAVTTDIHNLQADVEGLDDVFVNTNRPDTTEVMEGALSVDKLTIRDAAENLEIFGEDRYWPDDQPTDAAVARLIDGNDNSDVGFLLERFVPDSNTRSELLSIREPEKPDNYHYKGQPAWYGEQVGTSDTKVNVTAKAASIGPDERGWGDRIDLWAVGGQSNAQGRGDDSQSLTVDATTALYFDGEGLAALNDPVDGALTGSAWPAFAKKYFAMTGTQTAWVVSAAGATSQVAAADTGSGTWDQSGDLRANLVSDVEDAMSYLRSQGYNPHFRGILWSQGERDAQSIDDGTISIDEYESAIREMLSYFHQELPDSWSFGLFETGMPNDGDTAGFKAIRRAQRNLIRDPNNNLTMYLSGKQRRFPDVGHMKNRLHYTQGGYNTMGSHGAERLCSGSVVPKNAPTTISATTPSATPGSYEITPLEFDRVDSDEYDQASLEGNKIVIEAGGEYAVEAACIVSDSVSSGTRLTLGVRVVNDRWLSTSISHASAGKKLGCTTAARSERLNSGDELIAVAFQDSGGQIDTFTQSDAQQNYLSVFPTFGVGEY